MTHAVRHGAKGILGQIPLVFKSPNYSSGFTVLNQIGWRSGRISQLQYGKH